MANIMTDNMKSVYILQEGDSNRFKIGFSGDIENRIKDIQVSNSHVITLVDYFNTDNPSKVEKLAHKFLPKNRIIGEWFILSYSELANLCSYIICCIINLDGKLPANKMIYIKDKDKNNKYMQPEIEKNNNINVNITNNKIGVIKMSLESNNGSNTKKYGCVICEFFSNNLYDYRKHVESQKHAKLLAEKLEELQNEPEPVFKCDYCDNEYASTSSLSKHKKACIELKKTIQNTDKDNEISVLKGKVETLEKIIESFNKK